MKYKPTNRRRPVLKFRHALQFPPAICTQCNRQCRMGYNAVNVDGRDLCDRCAGVKRTRTGRITEVRE